MNTDIIRSLNIRNRTEQCKQVEKIFPEWKRESSRLYDYRNQFNRKIELKIQSNRQWIDPCKFTNLNEEDKEIIMVFVFHKNGCIDLIASTYLKEFAKMLRLKKKFFQYCCYVKQLSPSAQIKHPVEIRTLFKEYRNKFTIIWAGI